MTQPTPNVDMKALISACEGKDIDVYYFQGGQLIHTWETSSTEISEESDLAEAVSSTDLMDKGLPLDIMIYEENKPEGQIYSGRLLQH